MNTADAERLITPLRNAGWTQSTNPSTANLLIYVTCSVRQKSEDKVYGLAESVLALKKKSPLLKVIVTGCMAARLARGNRTLNTRLAALDRATRHNLSFADYVLSTPEASKLIQQIAKQSMLTDILKRRKTHSSIQADNNISSVLKEHLSISPHFSSEVTAFIPISYGCDNFCSYCVVPYSRGPLNNRPAEDIINETKTAIKSGRKEIYLLGQNVNSWVDQTVSFSNLLSTIDSIKGSYWIRFISSHPKDISNQLIDIIARGNHIAPCLHFALQSGSNSVLKRMNRHYTYKSFKTLVDYARQKVPGIAITTDVIVGFPGETEKEFSDSVKAFRECKFDMAYISMYSPRPGTVSAETMMDDIPQTEKKHRWQVLTDLLGKQCLTINKELIGKTLTVLTDKHVGRKGLIYTFGRCSTNKEIKIQGNYPLNTFAKVEVSVATPWSLQGVLLAPVSCCLDHEL